MRAIQEEFFSSEDELQKYSDCSVKAMKKMLASILERTGPGDCFSDEHSPTDPPTESFCGNGVVEPQEECDCGTEYQVIIIIVVKRNNYCCNLW